MQKLFRLTIFAPKRLVAFSLGLFLFSLVPAFILNGGEEILCWDNTNNDGVRACMDFYGLWANLLFISSFGLSLLTAVFAFHNDVRRWRIFWKTLCFLIIFSTVIIFLGFHVGFCLMWSCTNFGGLGILISLFCSATFTFALSWSLLLENWFKKKSLTGPFWVTFVLVSILYAGGWQLIEGTQAHEHNIANNFNASFDKQSAINDCENAFFPSTKNICLDTYSVKLHDGSICRRISSSEKLNLCVSRVKCSYFHPLYKTWVVGEHCNL